MCTMLTSLSVAALCSKSPKRFSPALRAALHASTSSDTFSPCWRSSCASAEAASSRSRLSFSAAWQPCRVFRAPAVSALAACASTAPSLAACSAQIHILIGQIGGPDCKSTACVRAVSRKSIDFCQLSCSLSSVAKFMLRHSFMLDPCNPGQYCSDVILDGTSRLRLR